MSERTEHMVCSRCLFILVSSLAVWLGSSATPASGGICKVINGDFESRPVVGWDINGASETPPPVAPIIFGSGGNPCSYLRLQPSEDEFEESWLGVRQEGLEFCHGTGFATIEFDARGAEGMTIPNRSWISFLDLELNHTPILRVIPDSVEWVTYYVSIPLEGIPIVDGAVSFTTRCATPPCHEEMHLDIDNVRCFHSDEDLTSLFDSPFVVTVCEKCPIPADPFRVLGFGCGTTPSCPWDLDGDGTVGSSDLAILLSEFGPCPTCCLADFDDDGDVDSADLAQLLGNWGPCPT